MRQYTGENIIYYEYVLNYFDQNGDRIIDSGETTVICTV